MGYYRGAMMGDFYRGYRGDPGFFSSLGGLFKKAASIGASFIPGVGGIASKVIEHIPVGAQKAIRTGVDIAKAHPVLTAAGAAGVVAGAGGVVHEVRKMGAPSAAGMAHAARVVGGGGGRHRRMRVTNVKALRRALRRAYGFERLAMKVIRLTSPRKHKGFAGFKHRRKKRI